MHYLNRTLRLAAACTFIVSTTLAAKPDRPSDGGGTGYDLIVLAPLGTDTGSSTATDLNEFGKAVGYYSDLAGDCYGFYYDSGKDAYALFGAGVEIHGLNNLGEMVGVDNNTSTGLYWRSPADQAPAVLAPLPGHTTSHGIRMNDAGIIVGRSQGDGLPIVVAWTVNVEGVVSGPVELPIPADAASGTPVDLSEADSDGFAWVAGYSDTYQTAIGWEVRNDGTPELLSGPTDLGSLAGTPSAAHGVNFYAEFVGESNSWPFLKLNGAAMQPLPGLRKATHGYAAGINDDGLVVGSQGWLSRGTPVFKAVLWQDPGTVVDLNTQVPRPAKARSRVATYRWRLSL